MKKAFPDEMAREIGYQKYYPTGLEWLAYFTIAFTLTALVAVALTWLVLKFS